MRDSERSSKKNMGRRSSREYQEGEDSEEYGSQREENES